MKKQKKITLVAVLLIVLLMGIGYAAITGVTLTINGTAKAEGNQDDFDVHFTGVVTPSENVDIVIKDGEDDITTKTVVGEAAAGSTAGTLYIYGLSAKDDTKNAIFEIENTSDDVDATIYVSANGTNSDHIVIDTEFCDSTGTPLNHGASAADKIDLPCTGDNKTYVKVSATLTNTVIESEEATIAVELLAEPVQK